ncbi:MAG: hypothetical protein RL094_327 [Candidatus Parcubacteria bacterium]|jgi:DNA helicase-2/ATP-dependent DNA helicase PcrA
MNTAEALTFQERYKKLNKAQKQAVDTIEGPVLVVAGPGTGKTTILTLRIANILLKTDTPPSGILAITFTDAGVKAMKEKLREVIGSRADEVRIHTFHGFAAAVIAEFKDHFVHLQDTRQMTDIDAEALVRSILTGEDFAQLRPFGNPDFYIYPLLSGIRDAKKEALSPEALRQFAKDEIERTKNDEESISTRGATKGQLKADAKKYIEKCEKTLVFADVYEAYEAQKKERKLLDFDDLIFQLLLTLGKDELLLRLLQEKFLYILVDEHQDTNDSQNLIVKVLADFFENPNVFIVGDEKQAIYRFQGASVENFLSFSKRWKGMTTISLEDNYRSHQHILDASYKMIENNYSEGEHEHLRIKLSSGASHKERPIDVVQAADAETAEQFLVKELKRIVAEEPEKTVSIISKTNRDVERVIRLCQSYGVPVSAERSIDIFSHPVGIVFFALIQAIVDPLDGEALGKTVISGLWNLSFQHTAPFLKQLRSKDMSAVDEFVPKLSQIRKELLGDSPISFIMYAADQSGLTALVARDPAFVEVWRGIVKLSESISRQEDIRDPRLLIEKLLAYKTSAETKSVKVKIGVPEAGVKVMTAHGSKGLEFDYVFIPYATEESWSSRAQPSYFVMPFEQLSKDGDDIRDVRRLFYVALTRAKQHATVLVPIEDSGGELLTPLRFVDELDQKSVEHIQLAKVKSEDVLVKTHVAFSSEARDKAIHEFAKHILLESGLSVTALNHFIQCPSSFVFKSILKIPEAPHPSAEKGIAMHLAFDRIWKAEDKSLQNIRAICEKTIVEHIDSSLLYSYQKEAVKKELLEQVPDMCASLLGHFAQKGEVFTEAWTKTDFVGAYDGKEISIPIHGKLDALIDAVTDVYVYDYKTRGKMSVNQIKGLTKSSDGNYFRQLVFYKMLLMDQSKYAGKKIIPSLVFLTPDEKGNCHTETLPIEAEDIVKVKTEIQALIHAVWSGTLISANCDDTKCEWCNLKKVLA